MEKVAHPDTEADRPREGVTRRLRRGGHAMIDRRDAHIIRRSDRDGAFVPDAVIGARNGQKHARRSGPAAHIGCRASACAIERRRPHVDSAIIENVATQGDGAAHDNDAARHRVAGCIVRPNGDLAIIVIYDAGAHSRSTDAARTLDQNADRGEVAVDVDDSIIDDGAGNRLTRNPDAWQARAVRYRAQVYDGINRRRHLQMRG